MDVETVSARDARGSGAAFARLAGIHARMPEALGPDAGGDRYRAAARLAAAISAADTHSA